MYSVFNVKNLAQVIFTYLHLDTVATSKYWVPLISIAFGNLPTLFRDETSVSSKLTVPFSLTNAKKFT